MGIIIDSSKGIKARNFLILSETAKLLHQHGYIDDNSLEQRYRSEAQKAITEFEESKKKIEEFLASHLTASGEQHLIPMKGD